MVRLHSPRVQCPFHVFFEMITALQNRTLYIKRRMPFLSFPGDKSTCLVIVFDFVPLPQISLLLADSIFTTEIPRKRDLSLTHFERKFWEIHIFSRGKEKGKCGKNWENLRQLEPNGAQGRGADLLDLFSISYKGQCCQMAFSSPKIPKIWLVSWHVVFFLDLP